MKERVLDVLWMEPPEPLERTLEAIESLPPDERLRLLIHRAPKMLYPILKEWGYAYETSQCPDGTYEILIWRKEADRAGEMSDE